MSEQANKMDELLSEILYDIYGKKYKVCYIEEVSEEAIKKRKAYAEEMQKQAIVAAQKQAMLEQDMQTGNDTSNNTSNFNGENSNAIELSENPPAEQNIELIDDKDIPFKDEEYLQELEEVNVILGTLSKAKEFKVKIKEIEASNKRITLEGRIVTCQARETKTGKGMLIYDVYDGSGIITCKSFTKNIEEYYEEEVLKYYPDAWIDTKKDKVGYEINFTQYFYIYEPPRPLEEIEADLDRVSAEILELRKR